MQEARPPACFSKNWTRGLELALNRVTHCYGDQNPLFPVFEVGVATLLLLARLTSELEKTFIT